MDRPQDAIVIGKSKQKDSFVAPDGSKKYFSDPYKDLVFRSVCNTTDYFLHHPKLKNIDQFLVLSNLAGLNHVASHLVNLLRFINVDPETAGKRVCVSFGNQPCYIPLATRHISEVAIELRSLDSQLLDIRGAVRILLHIREKK